MIRGIKKTLVLGSGALKIGESGEFDYSGSQAIKALKSEGVKVVLVNPNIATVQTSEGLADRIYFLPVNAYFVEKIIEKEKPDSILLGFGGQTALNCGVELEEKGILAKHKVKVLGTPVKTIVDTEDRGLFVEKLDEISLKTPQSIPVNSTKEALVAAKKIGFPVMARIAYALGGLGSGICKNSEELRELSDKAFTHTGQVLIEKCLKGWKEVEYEIMRDKNGNSIIICNMENLDPLGIHTGESIVVAPSQTLSNKEYHFLREISLKATEHLGIIGECNIQFALNPENGDYRIIEMNPRLSRSSALASKATGFPIAFVAAKLSLGHSLPELKNSITKATTACFEPALDYLVVKVPRWDLKKFRRVSKQIGSSMKSVGEVMAIGRGFEETLQKALRMVEVGADGLSHQGIKFKDLKKELSKPTDERIFAVADAFRKGMSTEKIFKLTKIDPWFLYRIKNIVRIEKEIKKFAGKKIPSALLLESKKAGFSDKQIAVQLKSTEEKLRTQRLKAKIRPVIKQINTLAGEFPAKTNYLYLTYNGTESDQAKAKKGKGTVIILGGGPYRIGSSVEFDWCCVNTAITLRKEGFTTIMINNNPETVSTDYDTCDKLYFEELNLETVLEINKLEKPLGVIVSMGGQTPNMLALPLHKNGVKILGSGPDKIDQAENRYKFSSLLDRLGIQQPEWKELTSFKAAKSFAGKVGYPVLVRPSYVLSGEAMGVAMNEKHLALLLSRAADLSKEHPAVISKFITGAKEIDLDAVAKNGKIIALAVEEHIENAGIHSGDATMLLPPRKIYFKTVKRVRDIAKASAKALNITGPFNIQFIAKDNEVKVIELNLRASRSFPFVSKVSRINFIELATKAIMGLDAENNRSALDLDYCGVKAPQFSFSRLAGADPVQSVEMSSTGEVACLGDDAYEAFLKSIISTGFKLPKKNVLVSISGEKNRVFLLNSVKRLKELGFNIYCTKHTSQFMKKRGVPNKMIYKIHETHKDPNVKKFMEHGKIELAISIPDQYNQRVLDDQYTMRRLAIDYSIPLLSNMETARMYTKAIDKKKLEDLEIKAWQDY